jgi:predicted phage terminase large subunit-like protein
VDLALSTGRGDFTVFVVAGIDHLRNIYILDVERHQFTPDNAVYVLFRLYEQYKASDVLIDDDPGAKVFHRLFLEIARTKQHVIAISAMPLRGNDKETRAAAIRGMFLQHTVFIKRADWNADLHAEIYDFPNGDHDDQIDCLSLIGRRVPQMSAPTPPHTGPLLKPIIKQRENGDYYIDVALDKMFTDREQDMTTPIRSRARI